MARGGLFRNLLTIKDFAKAQNSFGEETKTWQTFAQTWGSIEPIQGRAGGKEDFAANQRIAESNVLIHCRYAAGVTPLMRVSDGTTGAEYEIITVADVDNRQRELELSCRRLWTS